MTISRKFRSIFLSASLAVLPLAGLAQVYEIDPAHSSVSFRIRHLAGKVPGLFKTFSGTIDFNEKKVAKSSVKAVIQAASIDTNNEKRNNHLRSADFFDVEKFPDLTFTSTRIVPAKKGHSRLEGILVMHGVSKLVSLDLVSLGSREFMGHKHASFEAHGTLNRKDFGIVWNKTMDSGGLMLSDEVQIDLQVEAVETEK